MMKKQLEKLALFLYKKYGITPNTLIYIRIFAAPWLALFISRVLSNKSLAVAIFTLLFYAIIAKTIFLNKILNQIILKEKSHDYSLGGILDRLSYKILIIFVLIPFGLNLFTFLIISAESILSFQAIFSPQNIKLIDRFEKIKMILQILLVPILLLQTVTNFIPEFVIYIYILITIVYTFYSVYSHLSEYFYFEK